MLRHFRLLVSIMVMGSAAAVSPPRMRVSPYFGNIVGMSYTGVDDLGDHDYDGSLGENNDLIYTACAGFIDLGHLRESADRARYIFEISQEHILNGDSDFSFEVIESASYHIHVGYPAHWHSLMPANRRRSPARSPSTSATTQHI